MYFIVLFVITMKRQIKVSQKDEHAQKHDNISQANKQINKWISIGNRMDASTIKDLHYEWDLKILSKFHKASLISHICILGFGLELACKWG